MDYLGPNKAFLIFSPNSNFVSELEGWVRFQSMAMFQCGCDASLSPNSFHSFREIRIASTLVFWSGGRVDTSGSGILGTALKTSSVVVRPSGTAVLLIACTANCSLVFLS